MNKQRNGEAARSFQRSEVRADRDPGIEVILEHLQDQDEEHLHGREVEHAGKAFAIL